MNKKVKVVLNKTGVGELLKSQEMMKVCEEQAESILGKVGDGYEMVSYVEKTRVGATVFASSYKAKKDCYDNNTLLKAVQR